MSKQDSEFNELGRRLEKIIRKIKKVQRSIAGDDQPASMHELDRLTDLGQRYAALLSEMQALLERRAQD